MRAVFLMFSSLLAICAPVAAQTSVPPDASNSKNGNGNKPPKKQKRIERAPEPQGGGIQYVDVYGIDCVAESKHILAQNVKAYVYDATIGQNSLALFTGSETSGYSPMRLVLEGDSIELIATAFERIADAMTGTKERQ